MTDLIIVGRGLAAMVAAHSFRKQGVSFHLVGSESLSSCSRVAAGIWNPVVFKRLTKSWLADELIPCLNNFYSSCEQTLGKKLITQRLIIKPFTEDQEKTLWMKKTGTAMQGFIDETIYNKAQEELQNLKITNGYGVVRHAGNLNVAEFLEASSQLFREHLLDEVFDHTALEIAEDKIKYKSLEARQILFCEGHLVKNNPLFSWLPLKPAKGEILTVDLPGLELHTSIFNRNGFLMNVAGTQYRVGATYAWNDLSETPTVTAREELEDKLKASTSSNYRIVKHEAGIRPSSIDRRPFVGAHPKYHNVFVFNGLGTKGVMLAPYFAENFVNFFLKKEALHEEADVKRFYHLYET